MNPSLLPRLTIFGSAALFVLLVTLPAYSDDSAKAAGEPASASDESETDKQPETIKVQGVLEATRSTGLAFEHKQLTDLKLARIVPHGTSVKKGQAIVWLETKDFDKKLRESETDLQLAALTLEADEFSYEQFLKTQELDRAAAKRTRNQAQSDYDYFVKTELERDIINTKQSLKSSEFSVESTKEELDQLRQMYEEDDLTEESEEIVLRRAQFSYESALNRLTDTKLRTSRSLQVKIPRTEVSRTDTLERAMLTYDQTMKDLTIARQKRQLEIERKRRQHAEKQKDFETMRQERKAFVLKAAHDGILLHGKLIRGKLPAKPSALKPGSKIPNETVFATLADPNRLQIRIDLAESNLSAVTKGKSAVVRPKSNPKQELKGTVRSVSHIPYVPGKFDCLVSLAGKNVKEFMPTMECDVEFEKDSE